MAAPVLRPRRWGVGDAGRRPPAAAGGGGKRGEARFGGGAAGPAARLPCGAYRVGN